MKMIGNIKNRLIRFLANHPHSADSVSGIGKFWLGGEDPQLVSAALVALAEQGLVECRGNGANVIFLAHDSDRLRELAHQQDTAGTRRAEILDGQDVKRRKTI